MLGNHMYGGAEANSGRAVQTGYGYNPVAQGPSGVYGQSTNPYMASLGPVSVQQGQGNGQRHVQGQEFGRNGKRFRDGQNLSHSDAMGMGMNMGMNMPSWKRQQQPAGVGGGMDGRFHPCLRVYGHCRDGPECPYARAPFNACLQHMKGQCKYGDRCHEPHVSVQGGGGKSQEGKHPCVRIYGFCREGDSCRFIDYPLNCCLQFLHGRCKFGDRCHELHYESGSKEAGN